MSALLEMGFINLSNISIIVMQDPAGNTSCRSKEIKDQNQGSQLFEAWLALTIG